MELGTIREVDTATGEVLREFEIELDNEFYAVFLDSLFSWAKRGAKPQTTFESSDPKDDYKDLDSKVLFGKHRGKTWKSIISDEPDYVSWCIENVDRLPKFFKTLLREALDGEEGF